MPEHLTYIITDKRTIRLLSPSLWKLKQQRIKTLDELRQNKEKIIDVQVMKPLGERVFPRIDQIIFPIKPRKPKPEATENKGES